MASINFAVTVTEFKS